MTKRLISFSLALMLLLTAVWVCPMSVKHAQAEPLTGTVKGGWLRLRTAPSFSASVIRSYYTGTKVTILGTSGAWYHVQVHGGLEGYMYSTYITIGGTPSGTTAYVTSDNGKAVRLRSGPGVGYGVIGLYNVGTKVTILSKGTYWHYIRVGSQQGYMMAMYLTTGAPPVPPPGPGYDAYVTSANGKGVRMRSGPGTGYGVIGFYEVGTPVTVLNYGATWCYIQVGSLKGYMMTKYLTTENPGVLYVTAVSLSSYKPQVGTVLTAKLSPAAATVSYTWYDDDGAVLGSKESLTVTAAMAGKRIRLMVNGTGSYQGSAYSSWTEPVTAGPIALTGVSINNMAPAAGQMLQAIVSPNGATADVVWYNSLGDVLGTGDHYMVTIDQIGLHIYCIATGTGNTVGVKNSAMTAAVTVPAVEPELPPEEEETPSTPEEPEQPTSPAPGDEPGDTPTTPPADPEDVPTAPPADDPEEETPAEPATGTDLDA